MTRPAISIGVPVFNGARYLEGMLQTVLDQSMDDLEVVICDNASTDATREICEARAARDPRIRYHRQERNFGAARNYNDTFRRSRGRYFKWAAHDDLLAPDFLERCFTALEALPPSTVLAYPGMRFIDGAGAAIGDYTAAIEWDPATASSRLRSLLCVPNAHSHLNRCLPALGLIRREALARTRLIGAYNSSDKVVVVELALQGDFHRVDDWLFFRRQHAASSLAANRSARDVARWFDTTRRRSFVTPQSRLFVEYARAVMRTDLPPGEKRRCLQVTATLLRQKWRLFGGEIKNSLKDALGLRETPPA